MCMDCPAKNPEWASLAFGVFVCLTCSGHHRNLGVHVTFVRSASYDRWSSEQVNRMSVGGNQRARAYFRQHGLSDSRGVERYNTPAARTYKLQIDALAAKPAAAATPADVKDEAPLSPTTPPPVEGSDSRAFPGDAALPSTGGESSASPAAPTPLMTSMAPAPAPKGKRKGLGGTQVAVGTLKVDERVELAPAPPPKPVARPAGPGAAAPSEIPAAAPVGGLLVGPTALAGLQGGGFARPDAPPASGGRSAASPSTAAPVAPDPSATAAAAAAATAAAGRGRFYGISSRAGVTGGDGESGYGATAGGPPPGSRPVDARDQGTDYSEVAWRMRSALESKAAAARDAAFSVGEGIKSFLDSM